MLLHHLTLLNTLLFLKHSPPLNTVPPSHYIVTWDNMNMKYLPDSSWAFWMWTFSLGYICGQSSTKHFHLTHSPSLIPVSIYYLYTSTSIMSSSPILISLPSALLYLKLCAEDIIGIYHRHCFMVLFKGALPSAFPTC